MPDPIDPAARPTRRLLAARVLGVFFLLAVSAACAVDGGDIVPGPAPLVLISLDGFRWDYPELTETPNLDRLIARGVRAQGLVPPFPSKTFPGHYTLVTGLHPGHHGIISNQMRDPGWPEEFGLSARAELEKQRWWGGEPIWVTAHRAGLRTGVFFWPGSEAPVQGVQPTFWYPFDITVPFEQRIDEALGWLRLPEAERPRFVALYLDEPNTAGHRFGPESAEALAQVRRVDTALGRLLDGLAAQGQLESSNVIVVTDHGMAQNSDERIIVLEDYVELFEDELFEQGAYLQIFPHAGREQLIYAALRGAHPNLRVFRRGEYPEELHLYDHPRAAPIVGTPDVGWEVYSRAIVERTGWRMLQGNHGQNPSHPDMHGILVAAGPAFAVGVDAPAVHAVDLYNAMAWALGLEPAVNDGSPERIQALLREPR